MQGSDPTSAPEVPPPVASPDGPGPAARSPLPTGRLWQLALMAGVVTGLTSWAGGEAIYSQFRVGPRELPAPSARTAVVKNAPTTKKDGSQIAGGFGTPYGDLYAQGGMTTVTASMKTVQLASQLRISMMTYGLLGAALGLTLGLAGGLARRSVGAAAVAAVAGAALGGVAGAGVSWWLVPRYFRSLERASEMAQANDLFGGYVVHAGVWAAVGLAGGLALGLGVGGRARLLYAVFGGVLGALLAASAYEILGTVTLPAAETGLPVPNVTPARALAHLLVAVLVAVGATLTAQHLVPKRPAKV